MQLGIFARTFTRSTVEETFDAVVEHGLHCVQFNMKCAGLPSLPDHIENSTSVRIQVAAALRNIDIAAVSGTYNMIHPDPEERQAGLQRLRILASSCKRMGTSVITLCTGTRDPDNMWRWHPANTSPQAWEDLVHSMEAALKIAEEEDIILAFEPERANVINTAARARALLDTIQSPYLKIVMDPANLITPENSRHMHDILDEAFELLGAHIIIAHAKDIGPDNTFQPAGSGILDYDYYLHHLEQITYEVPLIIHGLSEQQVDTTVKFLHERLHRGR
ncbi:MAG TPA: sugar phosphate isomerase/epimerase [Ktedonobacteraceae bacterium]|nr:sugar phosphate isomerase/epimerase [Ktedonobacteraceae bacterium]